MAPAEPLIVAVGIDPGLRACGVAIADVQTSALLAAWLCKSPEKEDDNAIAWTAMGQAVSVELRAELGRIATERMGAGLGSRVRLEALAVERQAIRGDRKRGLITKNPGQILGLASVVGAIVALIPAARKTAVWPQSWNGNKSKDESTATVWRALSAEERCRMRGAQLASTGHNVIDSAGIAKWAAARTRVLILAAARQGRT